MYNKKKTIYTNRLLGLTLASFRRVLNILPPDIPDILAEILLFEHSLKNRSNPISAATPTVIKLEHVAENLTSEKKLCSQYFDRNMILKYREVTEAIFAMPRNTRYRKCQTVQV